MQKVYHKGNVNSKEYFMETEIQSAVENVGPVRILNSDGSHRIRTKAEFEVVE